MDKPFEVGFSSESDVFEQFLQDACMQIQSLWVHAGGQDLNSQELYALNDMLTAFFADKRTRLDVAAQTRSS